MTQILVQFGNTMLHPYFIKVSLQMSISDADEQLMEIEYPVPAAPELPRSLTRRFNWWK